MGLRLRILFDIKNVFSVEYSAYWNGTTGEDELEKLIVEYEVVKKTNGLLNTVSNSIDDAFKSWRETLKFIGISYEALRGKYPNLKKCIGLFYKIAKKDDILPETMRQLNVELDENAAELKGILDNKLSVFMDIYAPYLDGFAL